VFLIDANVLITANNTYFPLTDFPPYWEWLELQGADGQIKMPREIYEEISGGSDDLADWIKSADVKDALLLDEEAELGLVRQAMQLGYQADNPKFTDSEVIKVGRDAFLVAYGLVDSGRIVSTKEVSKRTKRLGASRLPDACDDCGVKWCDDFTMQRHLDFNLRR
jgi:hypothetical protein